MSTYTAEYDAWHADWHRHALRVMNELDKLRDDTRAWAQQLTRDKRYGKAKKDQAWQLVRERSGPLDALGRPIDRSRHGRATFERAWQLATGMPWTHPHDDEQDPAHTRGEHHDTPDASCLNCADDQLWADTWTTLNRKARR